MNKERQLILASGSPRRRELLQSAGLAFEVVVPDVEETHRPGETPTDYVKRNAREKAFAISSSEPETFVLAADTIVVLDGEILEKPKNEAHAIRMLTNLSGSRHHVMTGVALRLDDELRWNEVVVTDIDMRELSAEDIERYVATGEPLDKAGAYGIQGGAAGFVRSIQGSYTNVVGLPLAEVLCALHG